MTIGLLATGDELISGDTLNTTGQNIAHILNSEALTIGLHLTCGDNETEIHDCIQFLEQKYDIIIITGGLGPTSDDRTRFALSRFLKTPLVEFAEAINHIKQRINNPSALSEGNKQQSKFPPEATLLPNPNGTAMGCYLEHHKKVFILLPGPPRECLPMFNNFVFPRLQKTAHSDKVLLKWRLFGVAESEIAQQFDQALAGVDCETGYRLETPYVECKVKFSPHLRNTITEIIEPLVKPHIIASTEKKASQLLHDALAEWKKRVTIIDDVSGGLLQSLIQQPDNHSWVSFHEQNGEDWHFHLQGLHEYWTSQPRGGKTALSITFTHAAGKVTETHEIPYRSPLVIHYAAEWLSFRIFHLIDQLHQGITE